MPNAQTTCKAMEAFLRGPSTTVLVKGKFSGIVQARKFRVMGQGFSVSYQPNGTGKAAYVQVTKTAEIFAAAEEKRNRVMREIAYLEKLVDDQRVTPPQPVPGHAPLAQPVTGHSNDGFLGLPLKRQSGQSLPPFTEPQKKKGKPVEIDLSAD